MEHNLSAYKTILDSLNDFKQYFPGEKYRLILEYRSCIIELVAVARETKDIFQDVKELEIKNWEPIIKDLNTYIKRVGEILQTLKKSRNDIIMVLQGIPQIKYFDELEKLLDESSSGVRKEWENLRIKMFEIVDKEKVTHIIDDVLRNVNKIIIDFK